MKGNLVVGMTVAAFLSLQTGCAPCILSESRLRYLQTKYGDEAGFDRFQTLLSKWREADSDHPVYGRRSRMYAARCRDGSVAMLSRSDGFSGEVLYYDSNSGEFMAVVAWTDVIDTSCKGRRYWPSEPPRFEWVVSEVIRGDHVSVGDTWKH